MHDWSKNLWLYYGSWRSSSDHMLAVGKNWILISGHHQKSLSLLTRSPWKGKKEDCWSRKLASQPCGQQPAEEENFKKPTRGNMQRSEMRGAASGKKPAGSQSKNLSNCSGMDQVTELQPSVNLKIIRSHNTVILSFTRRCFDILYWWNTVLREPKEFFRSCGINTHCSPNPGQH